MTKQLENMTTIDNDQFVIYKEENLDMTIFGREKNLKRLFSNNFWMADGTFKICPPEYMQLYTIHLKFYEIWQPLIWILMKNRTTNDY